MASHVAAVCRSAWVKANLLLSLFSASDFPADACGPAQSCRSSLKQLSAVTLRLAHHQQDVDVSSVFDFTDVPESLQSGHCLSLDTGAP